MVDNIQIVNKTGDSIFTEGIAYIEIPSTGKKYLFYTLNEKVDNDLTKIYIAETGNEIGVANNISDDEWDTLRKKMIKISHKENVEDLNYLNMTGVTFNVGEPKKLAITTLAKQSFKEAQISNTLPTTNVEPANESGASFFNQSVLTETNTQVESAPTEPSIFANPPQPMIDTQNSLNPSIPEQPQIENVIDNNVVNSTPQVEQPTIPAPTIQENVPVEPIQGVGVIESTPVVPEQPLNAADPNLVNQQVAPVSAPVIEQPVVVETPQVEVTPAIETVPPVIEPQVEVNPVNVENKVIISDEEALKAINLIQEYLIQETQSN